MATLDGLLDAIRHQLGAEVHYAAPPVELHGGYWARIWRFRLAGAPPPLDHDLVARLMPDPDVARREMAVQQYVAELGFPTPRVRLCGEPGPLIDQYWAVMDHADGAPLLTGLDGPDVLRDTPRLVRELGPLLAQLAAQLHALPSPEPEDLVADASGLELDLHGFATAADAIGRDDLAAALARAAGSQPSDMGRVICHGDLHPFNVLVADTGPTVLDWSNAHLTDPAYDLAYTLILFEHPPVAFPAPLRPLMRLAGGRLGRRLVGHYNRLAPHPVRDETMAWFRLFHALRIAIDVGSWAAAGALNPHHPYVHLHDAVATHAATRTGVPLRRLREL